MVPGMESPALSPELIQSLLESLANWDPRASVPLALSFMEHGDAEALAGFDRLAMASPVAGEMLADRYLSPSPDVEALAKLPEGSLGKEFER